MKGSWRVSYLNLVEAWENLTKRISQRSQLDLTQLLTHLEKLLIHNREGVTYTLRGVLKTPRISAWDFQASLKIQVFFSLPLFVMIAKMFSLV